MGCICEGALPNEYDKAKKSKNKANSGLSQQDCIAFQSQTQFQMEPKQIVDLYKTDWYAIKKDDDGESVGTYHRIYLFSPSLSDNKYPIYAQLSKVSTTLFRIHQVNNHPKYLFYFDVCIPWEEMKLENDIDIQFVYHTDTEHGWIKTNINDKITRDNQGLYIKHEPATMEIDLLNCKKYSESDYNSMVKDAEILIIQHFLSCAKIFGQADYLYSVLKSLNIRIMSDDYVKIWRKQIDTMMDDYDKKNHNICNVYKLLILMYVSHIGEPVIYLSQESMFAIICSCLSDGSEMINDEISLNKIGKSIYNVFLTYLKKLFNEYQWNRMNNQYLMSIWDKIYLCVVFNFFSYFEHLTKEDFESKNKVFNSEYMLLDDQVMQINFDELVYEEAFLFAVMNIESRMNKYIPWTLMNNKEYSLGVLVRKNGLKLEKRVQLLFDGYIRNAFKTEYIPKDVLLLLGTFHWSTNV